MTNVTLDADKSEAAKLDGMQLALMGKQEKLQRARDIAESIASVSGGMCDIDIVQNALHKQGIDLGNAAGSVFKDGNWDHAGYKRSIRVSSHARVISQWRRKQ